MFLTVIMISIIMFFFYNIGVSEPIAWRDNKIKCIVFP